MTVAAVAPDGDVLHPVAEAGNFRVTAGGVSTTIPTRAGGQVTLTAGDALIGIGLPIEVATSVSTADNGTVVYRAPGNVNVAVQAIEGSVRIQTVISSADAPQRFYYPLTLPNGARAKLLDGGAIIITAGDGSFLGGIAEPWAKDARGSRIPTRYELHNDGITQVVEHDGTSTYPVVADPWLGLNLIAGVRVWNEPRGRVWTYSLTAWGHYWSRRSYDGVGQGVMMSAGWAEAKMWAPTVNTQNLHDQWDCHAFGGLLVTGTWDLESWRRSTRNVNTWISSRCNW